MGHIVFLTVYLGLVSGRQPVELRVETAVAMLRMTLDGKPVAALTSPPWRATVDFGTGLTPHELVAVGFDKEGTEVARATQAINIPRPMAEVDVTVEGTTASIQWRHRMNEKPRHASLRLDDKNVPLQDNRAALPKVDMSIPHVLTAVVEFSNGSARVERVIGGTLPDTAGTELTATAVRQTGPIPTSLDGCFASAGELLQARAVEKPGALLILVRDPNPRAALLAMGKDPSARQDLLKRSSQEIATVDAGTVVRLLWPLAANYTGTDLPTSQLFSYSGDFDAQSGGMLSHLVFEGHGGRDATNGLRFADAVAVAGIQAADGGLRRAVIVALDGATDHSRYRPSAVRHYLASIGVPLFVWSVIGPQPDLENDWGPIVDASTPHKVHQATDAVRAELETQRIAWLSTDPIHALRASAKPGCGVRMMATAGER
jgi:hypothetical protein